MYNMFMGVHVAYPGTRTRVRPPLGQASPLPVRGCMSTASAGGGASCPVQQRAAGFLAKIGVAPAFLDAQHDRCYCSTCYPAAWPDTIENEGPTPYVV
eukprot:COSAG01_NODE_60849_length_292_cov_1.077720_1_plen_97_part_11